MPSWAVGLAAHRQRHHRAHRRRRGDRLAAGEQPVAQRPGDDAEHDVVDGAAVRLARRAVVVELGARRWRSGAAVEMSTLSGRAGRGPAAVRAIESRPPDRAGDLADGRRRVAGGRAHVVHDRPGPARRPRRPRRAPAAAALGSGRGIHSSSGTSRGSAETSRITWPMSIALIAVDHRVVGLGDDREPALGQPLDQVHLPQRAGAVERARHQPGDQLGELLVGARPGQRGAAHVVGDVEVLVVDPHRAGQVARARARTLCR